jgi:hypothetical protein
LFVGDVRHGVDRQPIEGGGADKAARATRSRTSQRFLTAQLTIGRSWLNLSRFALAEFGLERETVGGGDFFVPVRPERMITLSPALSPSMTGTA